MFSLLNKNKNDIAQNSSKMFKTKLSIGVALSILLLNDSKFNAMNVTKFNRINRF